MFSYNDSIYKTSNSPTKEIKFEEMQHQYQHQCQQHSMSSDSYLSHPQHTNTNTHTNTNSSSNSNNNSGPLYPYNDMLYSIDSNHKQRQEQQQQQEITSPSTYDMSIHSSIQNHHYQHNLQQQQQDQQQRWQQEPATANQHQNTLPNSFYSDIRSQSQPQLVVDHSSPYDHHYNTGSPFSSPIPNNNVLMGGNASNSQRSSLQSLPSIPAIPSSSSLPSLQQHQQQHQQQQQNQRPRITTSLWDDEGTVCYQVDVRGICVARRQGKVLNNKIMCYLFTLC